MSGVHQITPAIRVVETDREWVIQASEMKRTRRRGTEPTGQLTDRAYITSRSSEHGETFHDHLPLIVKHGPLRWRNDRNARFEP